MGIPGHWLRTDEAREHMEWCFDEWDKLTSAEQQHYDGWIGEFILEAFADHSRGAVELPEHAPTCDRCGVTYIAEYEGPCQEGGCSGRVSWEAACDALRAAITAREAV